MQRAMLQLGSTAVTFLIVTFAKLSFAPLKCEWALGEFTHLSFLWQVRPNLLRNPAVKFDF